MDDDRGRTYGGLSDHERKADRRHRLLEAGLELLGSVGWDATSIERVCAEAGVATRSFYEEFAGREELLEAVYTEVITQAVTHVRDAFEGEGTPEERIDRALRGYVLHVTEEPVRAQLLHQDSRRLASLEVIRLRLLGQFFAVLPGSEGEVAPSPRPGLRARAVAGGLNEVIAHWLSSPHPRPDRAHLAEQVSRTLTPAALGAGGPA